MDHDGIVQNNLTHKLSLMRNLIIRREMIGAIGSFASIDNITIRRVIGLRSKCHYTTKVRSSVHASKFVLDNKVMSMNKCYSTTKVRLSSASIN